MNTLVIIAAAASALLGSALLVFSIQQLELEHGSQYHFALQEDVAARVSAGKEIVKMCLSLIIDIFLFSTGVVTSENYPNNYPNNLLRTEVIEVEQGLILFLEFSAFDIHSFSSFSCDDHLIIKDGDGTTLMEKSCGSSLPAVITSRSNMIKVVFSTDGSSTRSGFSLSWTAVTLGECQHA